MTVAFYNNEAADITSAVKPQITCEGITAVSVNAAGMDIPIGSFNEYRALVSVPKNTPQGDYSCALTISQTQKTFFLTVK
jgi:hypothetical protein